MTCSRIAFASLCFALCSAIAGQAQTIKLRIRPGLWEMTTTGKMSGPPPIPPELLAQLPPDRRAKIEAAVRQATTRASQPQTHTHCITEKDLSRGFNPDQKHLPDYCHKSVVSNAGNVMEVRAECTGRENVSARFRFQAVSPMAMEGTIDIRMSSGAHSMSVHRVLHAKWLGSDCGAVKPATR